MSLDGLRAWIGEVERKLGVRTRVFLVLTVIAIGIGGAAVYLAIDARESSVSEGDVQALQEQLETQIGEGGGGGLAQLEAEIDELRAEVQQPGSKGEAGGESGGGAEPGGTGGTGGANGESGGGGTGTSGGESAGGADGGSSASLGEVVQKAKEASERAEGK